MDNCYRFVPFCFRDTGIVALFRYSDQYCIMTIRGLIFLFVSLWTYRIQIHVASTNLTIFAQPEKCPTNPAPTKTKTSTSNKATSRSNSNAGASARAIRNPSSAPLFIHRLHLHFHLQHLTSRNNNGQNNRMNPRLTPNLSPSLSLNRNQKHNHKQWCTKYTTTPIKSWSVVSGMWRGLFWRSFCWWFWVLFGLRRLGMRND